MKQALKEAEKALSCGEFPVGCVVVDNNRIVARGSRTGTAGQSANELDHAEILALRGMAGLEKAPDPGTLTLYSTMEPCLMCFGAILINGIERIVYAYEDVMGGGTRCRLNALPGLYSQKNVSIVSGVLRNESLALFKAFFSDARNDYWRGSRLAQYTLEQ